MSTRRVVVAVAAAVLLSYVCNVAAQTLTDFVVHDILVAPGRPLRLLVGLIAALMSGSAFVLGLLLLLHRLLGVKVPLFSHGRDRA